MIKYLLLALAFLTRIPVPISLIDYKKITSKDLATSTLFYPVIGVILGSFYWLLSFVFKDILPREYLALLIITAGIFITGAMHEDGVADTADGFGSQNNKEDILRVMKDSRIGTYGSLSLILLVLFKFLLLKDLPINLLGPALLVAQVLPRWIVIPVMYFSVYGRESCEKSKGIVDGVKSLKPEYLLLSSVFAVAPALWLFGVNGALIIFLVVTLATLSSSYFDQKIQGVTGDCLGFIEQICELGIYILVFIL